MVCTPYDLVASMRRLPPQHEHIAIAVPLKPAGYEHAAPRPATLTPTTGKKRFSTLAGPFNLKPRAPAAIAHNRFSFKSLQDLCTGVASQLLLLQSAHCSGKQAVACGDTALCRRRLLAEGCNASRRHRASTQAKGQQPCFGSQPVQSVCRKLPQQQAQHRP